MRDAALQSLAVGFFDGVHLGHQAIVRELLSQARRLSAVPVVLYFEPHPRQVLGRGAPARLCSPSERIAQLLDALQARANALQVQLSVTDTAERAHIAVAHGAAAQYGREQRALRGGRFGKRRNELHAQGACFELGGMDVIEIYAGHHFTSDRLHL